MIGNTLDGEIADYIDVASSQAEIIADFIIFIETIIYEVSYRIILERSGDGANIVREILCCAIHRDNSRSNKTGSVNGTAKSPFIPILFCSILNAIGTTKFAEITPEYVLRITNKSFKAN